MPAATPTTLFIARHGQSEWNNRKLVTGQLDPGLSERGQEQARALADCLQAEPPQAIYTSALRRTAETAAPTAERCGLPLRPLAALNEIHLGVLQGRRRDDTDPEAQAIWAQWAADPWGFVVPGGEPFADFEARVSAALADILARHRGERVLVVGHRATNRVLLGHLFGWPRERWPELRLRNKYAYRLQLAGDGAPPAVSTWTLGGSKSGRREDGFVM